MKPSIDSSYITKFAEQKNPEFRKRKISSASTQMKARNENNQSLGQSKKTSQEKNGYLYKDENLKPIISLKNFYKNFSKILYKNR